MANADRVRRDVPAAWAGAAQSRWLRVEPQHSPRPTGQNQPSEQTQTRIKLGGNASIYRLYQNLGLQLRYKTPKRRVKAKLREDRCEAQRHNETWAMDFVHDQLATGRKIRVLTIVDTFSRFSPAVDPRFSYRGEDVVLTLERICKSVGYSNNAHGWRRGAVRESSRLL